MDKIFLSIVIPVYNEENRIERFLVTVVRYLKKKDFSYEIIIVDDGSKDATVDIIKVFLDKNMPEKYSIIKLPKNFGKGGAVRKGMLDAKGEYILFADADGSTSIEEIDSFLTYFKPEDGVYIGRRTLKKGAPFNRIFFGSGYTLMANCFLQLNISDYTCGFKCYRRDCAQKIFSRQTLNNWSFDTEDLFIARNCGYSIREVLVDWQHTPGSKVNVLKNIFVCAYDLLRIRYNGFRGKYSG